jgi:CubicO group peptidase (beta-lactamase class C family)
MLIFRFSKFQILIVLFTLLFAACKKEEVKPINEDMYFPPLQGNTWAEINPGNLGWCPQKIDELNSFVAQQNSKAFIILKNGKIVVEWYYDGFTANSNWYWASAGKTMTAFLIGLAQEQNLLNIQDPTSKHLGKGWTSLPDAKESLITIKHQLSMSTGLQYSGIELDCTLPTCLQYKADAGTQWYYHNAPYTLLTNVIEHSSGKTASQFTQENVLQKTGMNGSYVSLGQYNKVFFSTARSMARFGLLVLNKGKWENQSIMQDQTYFNEMISTSQNLNPSYGYLWWLNGKDKSMVPGFDHIFNRELIPNAPDELIMAAGANEQRIYIVPSENLVIIRMGDTTGSINFAPNGFDNELWLRLSNMKCN